MPEEPRRLLDRLTGGILALATAMAALWIAAMLVAQVWPIIVLMLLASGAVLAVAHWWRSRHW